LTEFHPLLEIYNTTAIFCDSDDPPLSRTRDHEHEEIEQEEATSQSNKQKHNPYRLESVIQTNHRFTSHTNNPLPENPQVRRLPPNSDEMDILRACFRSSQ
jgi:hypothetical protein